ncbi:MAG: hypothetical protein HY203_04795 [Nitrospirae bacterium]|nr:hypothetical protein [Nitrospirota bacterium]
MAGVSKFMIGSVGVAMALLLMGGCRSSTREHAPEAAVGVSAVGFDACYNCHADANNPASFPVAFGDTAAGSGGDDGNVPSVGPDWRTKWNGWLNGSHGNYESWNGTTFQKFDNAPANTGFPYYGYEGLGTDPSCTTACHDPLGDGKKMAEFFYKTGIGMLGSVDRPIIGCESCHGNGGNHWGIGPLPYPNPDPSRCGQCHNKDFPDGHLPFHPEGSNIVEDYDASKHAGSVNSTVLEFSGSNTDVIALCSRCHTDEGARRYLSIAPGTMTHDELESALNSSIPTIQNASANQCRTCHDGHNPLIILGQKALDAGIVPIQWSDEFSTCTSCHQLLSSNADPIYGNYTLLDNGYHAPIDKIGNIVNKDSNFDEIIGDTHFDNPATPLRDAQGAAIPGTGGIEGYVVDPTSSHDPLPTSATHTNMNSGTCRDCHNAHAADITINKQWARSAHGGFILDIKEQAANGYTAAVTDADAAGWVHYDFKSHPSRDACQRCHTSTGFRNFANAPITYNATNNVFGAAGQQAEMLYCWACHTSSVGDLRNPKQFVAPNYVAGAASVTNGSATVTGSGTTWTSGNTPVGSLFQVSGDPDTYIVSAINSTTQITLTQPYAGTTASDVNYQITPYIVPAGRGITGISGSFVCVSCHSGRETGEYIKSYPVAISGKNFGTFNSHYLAAGGVLFRTIGYEYSSLSYSNPTNFAHDTIGSVTAAGTGTNGPCVGCHMKTSESHLFLPTTRDATTDKITAITASAVCNTCHGASLEAPAMTPTVLNNLETQYNAALAAFQGTLNTKGICWTSAYPYFNVYDVTGCTTTAYTTWPNKDTLGAAFNMNMLEHMPMAFVHNSLYTRRLIFDSIDFLDNGTLDGNITATINGLSLTSQQKTDALAFLGGGVRP